jgi:hypothetical protein
MDLAFEERWDLHRYANQRPSRSLEGDQIHDAATLRPGHIDDGGELFRNDEPNLSRDVHSKRILAENPSGPYLVLQVQGL